MATFTETEIGDLVDRVRSWSPATDSYDAEFTYIDLSSVDKDSKSIVNPVRTLSADAPSRARQLVAYRDVLVSTVRPNLNGVAVVPPELNGATASTGFCVLRPRPEKVCWRYLYHWVRSPAFIRDMTRRATGASYPAVSDRIIHESKIPLPKLEEQKRIAAILDKADAIRRKRKEARLEFDRLLVNAFRGRFGDPITNWGHPDAVRFDSLTTRITYGFTQPMEHVQEGVPIVTAKNVREGFIDYENVHYARKDQYDGLTAKSKPCRGDILVTKDGAIRGRSAIVDTDGPICINQSVALIQPDYRLVTSEFLLGYLLSPGIQWKIQRMDKGAAMPHLQITELASFSVRLPPRNEQAQFSTLWQSAKTSSYRMDEAEQQANNLFNSLVQRAFKGEL